MAGRSPAATNELDPRIRPGAGRIGLRIELRHVAEPYYHSLASYCHKVLIAFYEHEIQWGWGGYSTHDIERCTLSARAAALVYNWWRWYVRLAHPKTRSDQPVGNEDQSRLRRTH